MHTNIFFCSSFSCLRAFVIQEGDLYAIRYGHAGFNRYNTSFYEKLWLNYVQSEEKTRIQTAFNTYCMPKIFHSIIPDGWMELPKPTGGIQTVIFLYNGCLGKRL